MPAVPHHVTNAGSRMPPGTVQVWDPFVRLFHWSLVALFATAYLTGEENTQVHLVAGYAIGALLVMRVVWGFVGPRHARFSDFVRKPGEVLAYLGDALRLRARRSMGHNPAGGVMVIALIVALAGTCVSGVMLTLDAWWGSEAVEEVHEALASGTVALVLLHVLGVIVAGMEHRENLVWAMITGRKRAE